MKNGRKGAFGLAWPGSRPATGAGGLMNTNDMIANPPMRWLKERNRWAAKLRSANWLLKKRPTIAAMGNAFRIHACCPVENPSEGRKVKMGANHAPQINNSSTIMKKS